MPGWTTKTPGWGYHGDDGNLFRFDKPDSTAVRKPGYMPYGPGDTIGCGVSFKDKLIFYTRNGKQLGMTGVL